MDVATLPSALTETGGASVGDHVTGPGFGWNAQAIQFSSNAVVAPTRLSPAVHLQQPFQFCGVGLKDLRLERSVAYHQGFQLGSGAQRVSRDEHFMPVCEMITDIPTIAKPFMVS